MGLKMRDNIDKEFKDAEYLEKLSNAGCRDQYGNPKQCTVSDDQIRWGAICTNGYTLDGESCDEERTLAQVDAAAGF